MTTNVCIAGIINLKSCTEVKERDPLKGYKFVFDISTEDRVYHLASETEEERKNWITTLNDLLFGESLRQVCFSIEISHCNNTGRFDSYSTTDNLTKGLVCNTTTLFQSVNLKPINHTAAICRPSL